MRYALKMGWSVERVHELSKIDPWFLEQIAELGVAEGDLLNIGQERQKNDPYWLAQYWPTAKKLGYSDVQLGNAWGFENIREQRVDVGLFQADRPSYKLVDTCAAEFEAKTPYYYSSYETPFVQDGEVQSPTTRSASPTARRSSSSAAGPTASARGSSSTTAAARPPSPRRSSTSRA